MRLFGLIGLVASTLILLELGRLEHISQSRNVRELLPLFRAFHKNLREAVDFAALEAPS